MRRNMSSYLKKSLLAEQLQKELEELSKNEDAKKEKQFFEDLKSVLDEHDYSFEQLHSMLSDVLQIEKRQGKAQVRALKSNMKEQFIKLIQLGVSPLRQKNCLILLA